MDNFSRRTFHREAISSLLTLSLLETVLTSDCLAAAVQPIAAKWLAELHQLGLDVKGSKLSQVEWQQQVEKLFGRVELKELLSFIDFDKLSRDVKFRDRGERSLRASFPEVEGLPKELVFGHQVFALREAQSVVPHGHDNMATAFLILDGQFRGRHYDRLADEGTESMIIRPTIDRSFGVGECSTVSDHKDNVHWFQASSKTGFIFNIHVLNVVAGKKSGRVYLDPNGERLADGTIRAKRIAASDAYRLYG